MSLAVRMRSSSGGSLSTGVVWDRHTIIHPVRVALRQLIMTSLAKQFTAPLKKTWTLGTDVYFTNWLQHHCGKKKNLETTRAIWSKPLFASCVALDQLNHDVYIFMVPRRYIIIKAIISCRAHCPWPVNNDVTCQTFHGSTDSEKRGTDVFFNSLSWIIVLNIRDCAKKASIETTWEQSVFVTSRLLAAIVSMTSQ